MEINISKERSSPRFTLPFLKKKKKEIIPAVMNLEEESV